MWRVEQQYGEATFVLISKGTVPEKRKKSDKGNEIRLPDRPCNFKAGSETGLKRAFDFDDDLTETVVKAPTMLYRAWRRLDKLEVTFFSNSLALFKQTVSGAKFVSDGASASLLIPFQSFYHSWTGQIF